MVMVLKKTVIKQLLIINLLHKSKIIILLRYLIEHEQGKKYLRDKNSLSDEEALQKLQKKEDMIEYYKYSANKGILGTFLLKLASQVLLGYAYLNGARNFPIDYNEAKLYFEKAINGGESEGYFYFIKIGTGH
jgi:hypothetical protein